MALRSEVVPAVGQVERLVDQRKVGNDVADHRVLEHRPVLPRRIVRMAAADRAVRARSRARPAPRRASPRRSRAPSAYAGGSATSARACSPSGSASTIARTRRSDSSDLVEAHRDARGDVAVASTSPCARRARRRARTGRSQRRSRACPLARPASPVRPSLRGELRRDDAAGAEAVLQAGVLVVDVAQDAAPRARAPRTASRIGAARRGVEIARDAAGHDAVHQQRWPKAARLRAQHVLLAGARTARGRTRSRRRCRGSRGRPDGWRRARARAAARAATRARRRRRRRRSPRAPARRPTRRRRCESPETRPARRCAVGERHRLEALLDALVHVAEALLQAQHLLADDLRSGNARAR